MSEENQVGVSPELSFDEESGISKEDQKDILQAIDNVVTENRIATTPEDGRGATMLMRRSYAIRSIRSNASWKRSWATNRKPSSTIPNRNVRQENLRAGCDGFALAIVSDSSLARRRRRAPVR